MEDTNLTYDSCKNCDRLEAEICRLEMIWETERGDNNRLKKENERLKQNPSPTGDRDCEELKKEVDILEKFNKRQFDTITELQEEIKRLKDDNKRDPWDDLGRNLSETTF